MRWQDIDLPFTFVQPANDMLFAVSSDIVTFNKFRTNMIIHSGFLSLKLKGEQI